MMEIKKVRIGLFSTAMVALLMLCVTMTCIEFPIQNCHARTGYQGERILSSSSEMPYYAFWNRTWGGTSSEYGNAVWSDGTSIYTCGTTYSFGAGNADMALVKWDANGTRVWNSTSGGANYDDGYAVSGDGTSIYTCGTTRSFGSGQSDMMLVKWNANGTRSWYQVWGGLNTELGLGIWCNGTSIYTCGYTESFGPGAGNLCLVKWDESGNQVWNKTLGLTGGNHGASAVWGDGTYIYTCGWASNSSAMLDDILLVKWNATGNQVWNRTWGGIGYDAGTSVWGDGTYIYTCGRTNSTGAGGIDMALVKWDASGHQLWNRTWGGTGTEYAYGVGCNATSVYICGYTQSTGVLDMVLVKWDASGNQLWNRTWGKTGFDYGSSTWVNGTGVYTCGYTTSYGAGGYDLVLVNWKPNVSPATTSPPPNNELALIIIILVLALIFILLLVILTRRRARKRQKSPETSVKTQ